MLLCCLTILAQPTGIINGTVTDAATGEALLGVNVFTKTNGGATNENGNYQLSLPVGLYNISFQYLGYDDFFVDSILLKVNDTLTINASLNSTTSLINEVIVSANRYGQSISKTPVSVELIKAKNLQAIAPKDATDAIRLSPGAYIIDGQINIRGGTGFSYGVGSRVQLVIDDLPLLSADRGDIKWNLIPLEMLDRIEVIKGASSVLYGSAALNGVVHARTIWPGNKPTISASAWAGVYSQPKNNINGNSDTLSWYTNKLPLFWGTQATYAAKFGKAKKFDAVVAAAKLHNKTHLENEIQNYYRANIKMRYRASEKLMFGIKATHSQINEGLYILWEDSAKLTALAGATDDNKYLQTYIDPFITYFDPINIKHSLKARLFNVNSFYDVDSDEQQQASINTFDYNALQTFKHFDWNLGVTYNSINVDDAALVTTKGWLLATYAQLAIRPVKKLELTAGYRWETFNIDSIKGATFPVFKGGLNYEINQNLFGRLSFGQGFRIPSFAERYVNYKIGAINYLPNEDLLPETGWNFEVGLKQHLPKINAYIDAALFVTDYNNMIEAVFDLHKPDSIRIDLYNLPSLLDQYLGWQFQNISDGRIAGLEYSFNMQTKNKHFPLQILAGYTYALPLDLNVDTTLNNWNNFIKRSINSFEANDSLYNQQFLKYRFQHIAKFDAQLSINKLEKVGFTLGASANYYSNMGNIDDVFLGESQWSPFIESVTGSPYAVPGVLEYRNAHLNPDLILNARFGVVYDEKYNLSFHIKNITNRSYTIRPAKVEAPLNYTMNLNVNF